MMRTVPFTRLIPNIVTLLGLVIGVSSIRFALDGRWEFAVCCIFVATIVDGIDGRLARALNATSIFGAELDSLCDFVNFGLSPAILIYLWSFQQYEFKLLSWGAIMLFILCMAIRLARFNTEFNTKDNKQNKNDIFFTGVPAPCGALLALIPIILDFEITTNMPFNVRNHTLLINTYIVIIALLLPSKLPTFSTKKLYIKSKYLYLSMIILAFSIVIFIIYPWHALPILAIIYLLSIPVCIYIKNTNLLKCNQKF